MEEKGAFLFEFTSRLEEKDYVGFNFYHSFGGLKWIFWVLGLGYFLFSGIDKIYNYFAKGMTLETFDLFFGIFFLIIPVVLPLYLLFYAKRIFQSDKFLQEDIKCVFMDTGILESTSSSDTFIDWDRIWTVKENNELIMIYIARIKAILIPKRKVDDALVADIKKLLREKIDENKLKDLG